MARLTGASSSQKTILLSLHDDWVLRYIDKHGWCLFQPERSRPFAKVKDRTIDTMSAQGWLTSGMNVGLGYRPTKQLTVLGKQYAQQLIDEQWGIVRDAPISIDDHMTHDDNDKRHYGIAA